MSDENSTADQLRDIMGGIGQAAGKAFGDKLREQEAQKKAGTHGWVKQSDGTSKWLPLSPAAGRPTLSASQPAGDEAPAQGIPRMVHHRGQQDYETKRTYPIGRARENYQKDYAVGEGNDPKGTERPRLSVKKQNPND